MDWKGGNDVSLTFWMISMFVLGVVALGLCYLFLKACEAI